MEISSDRAYWLLESYRAHATRLHFGGHIAGMDAACDAIIIAFDRDLRLAVVELFEEGGTQSWCRPIPLRDATFYLAMLGEPDFKEWAGYPFHLVLALRYPDRRSSFRSGEESSNNHLIPEPRPNDLPE